MFSKIFPQANTTAKDTESSSHGTDMLASTPTTNTGPSSPEERKIHKPCHHICHGHAQKHHCHEHCPASYDPAKHANDLNSTEAKSNDQAPEQTKTSPSPSKPHKHCHHSCHVQHNNSKRRPKPQDPEPSTADNPTAKPQPPPRSPSPSHANDLTHWSHITLSRQGALISSINTTDSTYDPKGPWYMHRNIPRADEPAIHITAESVRALEAADDVALEEDVVVEEEEGGVSGIWFEVACMGRRAREFD
ncbi:hypothetical protein Q7P37_000808 [Cladosporium fusiforme]